MICSYVENRDIYESRVPSSKHREFKRKKKVMCATWDEIDDSKREEDYWEEKISLVASWHYPRDNKFRLKFG